MLFFLYWSPAFVEYEQRISSIDFWDPVKFEAANAARTRHSNQWIRERVSIFRGRLYTVRQNHAILRQSIIFRFG